MLNFFTQNTPFHLTREQWALKHYSNALGYDFEMDAETQRVAVVDKFNQTALVLGEHIEKYKYNLDTRKWNLY